MSNKSNREAATLVYGGVPRAQLMPPEVAQRKKEQSRRRVLVGLTLFVLIVIAGGVAASYLLAAQSEQRLADERGITQLLLAQQQEYEEVLGIQARLDAVDAQRTALTSVEIEWRASLLPYLAVFGDDEIIDGVAARANRPFDTPLILSGPLRSPRSATIVITVLTATIPDAPRWLRAWEREATFADASLDTVVLEDGASYLTMITLNLNAAALSDRVTTEGQSE